MNTTSLTTLLQVIGLFLTLVLSPAHAMQDSVDSLEIQFNKQSKKNKLRKQNANERKALTFEQYDEKNQSSFYKKFFSTKSLKSCAIIGLAFYLSYTSNAGAEKEGKEDEPPASPSKARSFLLKGINLVAIQFVVSGCELLGQMFFPAHFNKNQTELKKIVNFFDKERRPYCSKQIIKRFDKCKEILKKDLNVPNGVNRLRTLANYPLSTKALNEEKITQRAHERFSTVDKPNKKSLMRFVHKVTAQSNSSHPKPCILYIQGPPGIGKTFCAKQFPAIFKLPHYMLNLRDKKDIKNLFTEKGLFSYIEQSGVLNCIFIIDEFDKLFSLMDKHDLLGLVLTLTDQSNSDLDIYYDSQTLLTIPYCPIIIATGNNPIPYKGLEQRMDSIYFSPLSIENKQLIAANHLKEKWENSSNKKIPKKLAKKLPDIVKHSEKDEGARDMITVIQMLIEHALYKEDEEDFDIESCFSELRKNRKQDK